jgi:hypothetical protein
MRLTEIANGLADPAASSPGAALGCAFFGYFLCTSKESDSRKARNAFSSKYKQESEQEHPSSILPCAARKGGGRNRGKIKIKIKMDPSLRWDDG